MFIFFFSHAVRTSLVINYFVYIVRYENFQQVAVNFQLLFIIAASETAYSSWLSLFFLFISPCFTRGQGMGKQWMTAEDTKGMQQMNHGVRM